MLHSTAVALLIREIGDLSFLVDNFIQHWDDQWSKIQNMAQEYKCMVLRSYFFVSEMFYLVNPICLQRNTYSCYTSRPRNFGVGYMQGLNVLIWPSWRSCRVTFVSQDLWWHFTVTWTHEKSLHIISSSVWALKGQKSCHAWNCIKHLVGPCIMRSIINQSSQ